MRENREKEKKQAPPSGGLQVWMEGFIDMATKVLSSHKDESLTGKDDLAAFLRTTPEALAAFEKAYHREVISGWDVSYDGLPNAKQTAARNGPGSIGGFRRTDSKNCNGAGFLDPGLPL